MVGKLTTATIVSSVPREFETEEPGRVKDMSKSPSGKSEEKGGPRGSSGLSKKPSLKSDATGRPSWKSDGTIRPGGCLDMSQVPSVTDEDDLLRLHSFVGDGASDSEEEEES